MSRQTMRERVRAAMTAAKLAELRETLCVRGYHVMATAPGATPPPVAGDRCVICDCSVSDLTAVWVSNGAGVQS